LNAPLQSRVALDRHFLKLVLVQVEAKPRPVRHRQATVLELGRVRKQCAKGTLGPPASNSWAMSLLTKTDV